ncbi:MAG: zinc ribbon domain-containing protein [Patescibacteria group bacterium]
MYCSNCGYQVTDRQKFCINCGNSLGQMKNLIYNSQTVVSKQKTSVTNKIMVLANTVIHLPFIEKLRNKFQKSSPSNLPLVDIPMGWFRFYTYFSLPFGFLVGLIIILNLGGFEAFFMSVNIIILGVLFYGLYRRKLWAWYLNFLIIVIEGSSKAFYITRRGAVDYDFTDGVAWVIFIIATLAWIIPNWIYFNKRKHLFV